MTGSVNYDVRSFINVHGDKMISGDGLKLVGFHFGRRFGAEEHIKSLRRRYGMRSWITRHLSRAGIGKDKLVEIYKTLIRPVLEYGAVAFHGGMTDLQSESLERLQMAALKNIYGPELSYNKCLDASGLERLSVRRTRLMENFATKAKDNPRFSARWFPIREESRYDLRRREEYREELATTNRLKNSPIFAMRRLLNQM